jgi:DNA-binding MarR family transcriptional regulator
MTTPSATEPNTLSDACAAASEDLGWSLGVVFRSLLKAANAAAAEVPGGQRGHHVLAAVSEGGPGTQSALAQQLGVDRTVMTYLLDDLEQVGLIARQPDPADRRARRVVITEAGRVLHCTLKKRMAEVADQVLAGLEPIERVVFRSSLHRAARHLASAEPATEALGPCAVVAQIQSGLPGDSAVASPDRPDR